MTTKMGRIIVLLLISLLALPAAGYADDYYDDLRGAREEVQKQQRDLAKAQRELREEIAQRDRSGIRKAQRWVNKETNDLREAKSDYLRKRREFGRAQKLHGSRRHYERGQFRHDDRGHQRWHDQYDRKHDRYHNRRNSYDNRYEHRRRQGYRNTWDRNSGRRRSGGFWNWW